MQMTLTANNMNRTYQKLEIGNGTFPSHTIDGIENLIKIPNKWLSKTSNLNDLIAESFDEIADEYKDSNYFANTAILTPLNKDVHEINEKVLEKVPGDETFIKLSEDKIIDDAYFWDYPTERLILVVYLFMN